MSVPSLGVRPAALAAVYLAKLVPGLFVLVSVPVWISFFGIAEYGRYASAWVACAVVQALGVGWLRQAALRFSGDPRFRVRAHPLPVLFGCVVASGLGAAVLVVVTGVVDLSDRRGMVVVFLFAATLAFYSIAQVAAQRDQRNWHYSAGEWARAGLSLVITVPLALASWPGFEAILLAASLANCVAAVLVISDRNLLGHPRSRAVAERTWRYGWPMSFWLGLSFLTLYVDRIILGPAVSQDALGTYAATSDLIVRGVSMLVVPVVTVLHPIVMTAHNTGEASDATLLLLKWSRIMIIFVSAIALGAALFGSQIFAQMGIHRADPVVIGLLSMGVGLWQYALIAHKWLELDGRTRIMTVALVIAVAVEAAWSLATVSILGDRGVASGMLVGTLVYLALVRAASRSTRTEKPRGSVER